MEPLGCQQCYFSVRGPQRGGAERKIVSAETLTLPLWLLSDETEPSLYLASCLSSLCVFLLLTFRISPASHHLFRYILNALFISAHLANFIFASQD